MVGCGVGADVRTLAISMIPYKNVHSVKGNII
jgi:hypothetical protein